MLKELLHSGAPLNSKDAFFSSFSTLAMISSTTVKKFLNWQFLLIFFNWKTANPIQNRKKERVRICFTSSDILFFLGRDDIISDTTDPRKKWSRPCLHVKLFFTKRKHKHVPPLSYFSFFLWYFLFLYLFTSDSRVIIQPGLWPNYRLLLWRPHSAFKNLTKWPWQHFDRYSTAVEGSGFSLLTLERYKTSEEDIWGQT